MAILSREEAEASGWIVDTSCYPWVAYKGARFKPDDSMRVLTDLEAELTKALRTVLKGIDKQLVQVGMAALAKAEGRKGE